MKIALYVGAHKADSLSTRLIWQMIRFVQKGPYDRVTHVEAIHEEHDDGTVTIASASLRDGGVRSKRVKLAHKSWFVVDVPQWDVRDSKVWFARHHGAAYDSRGALATVLPGSSQRDRWFCNEAVGASVGLLAPETFGPHQFAALAITLALHAPAGLRSRGRS